MIPSEGLQMEGQRMLLQRDRRRRFVGLTLALFLFTLVGWASGTSTDRPIQAATIEAGGICSTRFPAVKIDRVEPDGRYWWRGTTDSNAYTRQFQGCINTERSKILY